jgi:hypothetical protein
MNQIEERIKAALVQFWDERAILVEPGTEGTVDELLEPIESMTAVEVLSILDKIVGQSLPNTLIQAGGYKTRNEFVSKLSARVMAHLGASKK